MNKLPKIPKSVVVNGQVWTVSKRLLGEQHGQAEADFCKMLINENLDSQVKWVTFFHELVHSFFDAHDWNGEKKYTEEQIATMLGPALHAFMVNNCNLEFKRNASRKRRSLESDSRLPRLRSKQFRPNKTRDTRTGCSCWLCSASL